MGSAVHKHAVENGYTVVREIGGHGVGLEFHEDPWVSYTSKEDSGVLMVPGMIFTIEPMVNMGSDEIYTDEIDDWTVRTEDGLPSAQDMRSFAGKSHRKSGKKVLAMRSYLVYNHICCEKRWSSVTICVLRTSSIIKERKK